MKGLVCSGPNPVVGSLTIDDVTFRKMPVSTIPRVLGVLACIGTGVLPPIYTVYLTGEMMHGRRDVAYWLVVEQRLGGLFRSYYLGGLAVHPDLDGSPGVP